MIARAEIQRTGANVGLDPAVIDHDYALGCLLHMLAQDNAVRRAWVFKGGTSLAKCWFPGYRFSEDLDFTVLEPLTADGMKSLLESAAKLMQESLGFRTDLRAPSVETINDDYGRESFEGKVYYQGLWVFRGDARSIRIHVSRDELLCFPSVTKSIIHPYSDQDRLPRAEMQTYALEETVAEKLRAFSGQRRFAVARDIFDLHELRETSDTVAAIRAFPQKCAAKGIEVSAIDTEGIRRKKTQYMINWQQNLEYLLPEALRYSFDDAWETALGLLEEAKLMDEGK